MRANSPSPGSLPSPLAGEGQGGGNFPSPSGGGQGGGLVRNAAEGIRPATAGWTYLSFRTVRRKPGEELSGHTGNEETALIWLGGSA